MHRCAAFALSLMTACGGRLDAGAGAVDGSVEEPAAYEVPCGSPCPPGYYSAEWLAPDAAPTLCECVPLGDGTCASGADPTGPPCSCTICQSRTHDCQFDPYYGTLESVRCTE